MRVSTLLVAALATVGTAQAFAPWNALYNWINGHEVWHPQPSDFTNWLASDPTSTFQMPEKLTGENMYLFRQEMLRRAKKSSHSMIAKYGQSGGAEAEEYPYFKWIPMYVDNVIPDKGPVFWSAPCFQNNSATITSNADGYSWNLEITTGSPSGWFCSDFYLLATVEGLKFESISTATTTTINWTINKNTSLASEIWDMKTKGVRILRFLDTVIPTIENVLATLTLFDGELQKDVTKQAQDANLDFMAKYAGKTMTPRPIQEVIVDESQIHSGDFFGIIRLDGLDPMLAWAMGAATGHTTVALWINGTLNVCESTTKDVYWPTNGIQCTEYRTWLQQAKLAQYQVVHAPLTAAARAQFNETAAIEFFNAHAGLDYGYYNMLFGWIDTQQDNYVCLPPDFKNCLQWAQVEVLFGLIDKIAPQVSDLLVNQAYNNRLGTYKLPTADVYYEAYKQGIASIDLAPMVEIDSYVYDINKNGVPSKGKSMVCCVFVCNTWKAAGLFKNLDNDVNCGELTNWDDYVLNILDASQPRPQECITADPKNQLCQLEGAYTLNLSNYATKTPYAHMAEKCPSQPPHYNKPANC